MLLTFTRDIKYGLVPNGYSGFDNRPLYNSADASLLLFEQVNKFLQYTKDYDFIKEHIYEKLKIIIDNYESGIDLDDNNIYIDAGELKKLGCKYLFSRIDISNALETYAKKHQLGVVEELCGHGIGVNMHEDPDVPNFGQPHTGPLLKEGMVICIEPMLTLGKRYVYLLNDNWGIKTEDGKPAAHYENTVLITKDGIKWINKKEITYSELI